MARPKIDPVLLEAARQDFMSGMTLRQIAVKRENISLRTLGEESKKQGWVKQRLEQQSATGLPDLVRSVEQRVEILTRSQRERLKFVEDQVGMLVLRLSENLGAQDYDQLDPVRKLTMLKLATDIYTRVRVDEGDKARGGINIMMNLRGSDDEMGQMIEENEQLRKQLEELKGELEALRREAAQVSSIDKIVRQEVARITGVPLEEELGDEPDNESDAAPAQKPKKRK